LARERDIVVGRRGDSLTGSISQKSLSFQPDAGETLKIPCKVILTLIVGSRMGSGDKSLLSR
jgi:hypothetical protein